MVYTYTSTRADYDPAKLFIVCPPSGQAAAEPEAAAFAEVSGWKALTEWEGGILMIPVVPDGWKAETVDLPAKLYDSLRNSFATRNGRSLFARGGKLWCWETMVYLVGYEDGAVFAGSCAVAHPNRFAAVTLVGGVPDDYTRAAQPSDHWMVRTVSSDYHKNNNEIASCVWLLGTPDLQARQAVAYFTAAAGTNATEQTTLGGIAAKRLYNTNAPAQQVLLSEKVPVSGLALTCAIYSGLFEHVIRWKDGPDGTLRFHPTRTEYYGNGEYQISSVCIATLDYPYGVRLPKGMTKAEATGLPLVYSVHGRGEPAWMFCAKNGWDVLQDETRDFVLVVPDSPGNIWQLERDADAFAAMTEKICAEYALDRSRVYLTGFSNGGSITREVGTTHPDWFAAISPWNGPVLPGGGLMADTAIAPTLAESGCELPYWVCVGDSDGATAGRSMEEQLTPILRVNGCPAVPDAAQDGGYRPDALRTAENYYTPEKGYTDGERLCTRIYQAADGTPRIGYTVMKNMPHGAISDQSRAAWDFIRHFSRPQGSKAVVYKP